MRQPEQGLGAGLNRVRVRVRARARIPLRDGGSDTPPKWRARITPRRSTAPTRQLSRNRRPVDTLRRAGPRVVVAELAVAGVAEAVQGASGDGAGVVEAGAHRGDG